MYDGDPGEIDFASSLRGSIYRESTVDGFSVKPLGPLRKQPGPAGQSAPLGIVVHDVR